MITPKRVSVKFFATIPEALDLTTFKPVFQRWIQEHTLDNMLIDVADYKHMHEGPGVMLIAYEGDYALDLRDGKPGIQYTRKRELGADLMETLTISLKLALSATLQIEKEESLSGVEFDYSTIKIEFLDRLNYPNTPETLIAVKEAIGVHTQDLYGGAVTIESAHTDSREAFALLITAETTPNGATLLERLSGVNQPAS